MEPSPPVSQADLDALPPSVLGLIAALREANAKLEARVAELERRLGMNSSNSSKPPSSDPPYLKRSRKHAKSKRKQGGQPGHAKHERELVPEAELASPPVELKPEVCACCGEALAGEDAAPLRHQVTELPVVKPFVTEHRLHALTCARCGKRTRARLPATVPAGAFGPRAIAVMATLSGKLHLSRRATRSAMISLFGTKIALGMTTKLEAKAAAALAKPCEEIAAAVALAPVRNGDETPWPHGRREESGARKALSWLWLVTSAAGTVFRILPGRGKAQACEVLHIGEDGAVAGHIGSDRLGSYGCVPAVQRQVCLAHLARNFAELAGRSGDEGRIGQALGAAVQRMFALRRLRPRVPPEDFGKLVEIERQQLRDVLELALETGAAGIARNLLEIEPALWNHLEVEGLEATNNAAERALRPAVLWRKGSFGTMSGTGARFAERMLTATATAAQHGRDFLTLLQEALEGKHITLLPQPNAAAGA